MSADDLDTIRARRMQEMQQQRAQQGSKVMTNDGQQKRMTNEDLGSGHRCQEFVHIFDPVFMNKLVEF